MVKCVLGERMANLVTCSVTCGYVDIDFSVHCSNLAGDPDEEKQNTYGFYITVPHVVNRAHKRILT